MVFLVVVVYANNTLSCCFQNSFSTSACHDINIVRDESFSSALLTPLCMNIVVVVVG
jgi:hypothetical protein